MNRVVGLGEYVTSNKPIDTIKTFALSSCVAITAYSPLKKVAGMIHIVLPSPVYSEGEKRAGYYATTGICLLIEKLCNEYTCTQKELIIGIYGGANSANSKDIFNIGKRNIEAVKSTFSYLNMNIHKQHIGGLVSRTIELDVATGEIRMYTLPITI